MPVAAEFGGGCMCELQAPSLSAQEMEHYLKQNNAVDIYEEYFKEGSLQRVEDESPSAKTVSILR